MSIPDAIALVAIVVMAAFGIRATISAHRTTKRINRIVDEWDADLRRSKEPTQ